MSHTESEQEFMVGKAAMVPCGTWLETEMKNVTPPGTKLEYFLPPVVEGGKGDPTAMSIAIEPWMVPSKAKNPQAAIELFKYMTSLDKAKEFIEKKGTMMSIKGSDVAKTPDSLKGAVNAFKNSKQLYSIEVRFWYPTFEKELESSLTALLNKELTPEKFCDRVEAAAEKVRKDPNVTKHKLAK
jgi:N-acetylglucosamine transport system substrate-binding protein